MQRTKLQNFIFTVVMAFIMVYGMVCYNIALDKGGMSNEIFLIAFHEMPIMWPIAVILEMFVFEKLAVKLAFRFVRPGKDSEFMVTIAISSMIVALMCPTMSLIATLSIKLQPFVMLLSATPKTAQFVVIRGRYTPSAS